MESTGRGKLAVLDIGLTTPHGLILHQVGGFLMTQGLITWADWWQVFCSPTSTAHVPRRGDLTKEVTCVYRSEALEFLEKLNTNPRIQKALEELGCGGQLLRLPTEAEWEQAARDCRLRGGWQNSVKTGEYLQDTTADGKHVTMKGCYGERTTRKELAPWRWYDVGFSVVVSMQETAA